MKKLLGFARSYGVFNQKFFEIQSKSMCEKPNVEVQIKKDNKLDQVKISHVYEKDKNSPSKIPLEEKELMDKLIKDFLKETNSSKEDLEVMKENIRNPMHYTEGPNVFKINSNEDINNILKDVQGLFENHYAFKKVSKVIKYKKQVDSEYDENFQTIRKIDRVLMNSEIPEQIDKNRNDSPNFNSPDFLKKQERLEINYNYNFEQHRDFTHTFKKQRAIDDKRLLEEQKYLKHLKENKDHPGVKASKIPKLAVPVEKLPDYDVDVSNYKPERTKKSRRIYDRRLHDINITNYDAWRCFDRELESFYPGDGPSINVMLPPKFVVKAFGFPTNPENYFYTGTFTFEDSNLDIFLLTDYKQTTHYHGFNYSDEFFEKIQPKLNKRKRKQKFPEISDFWKSEEPKEFKIYYSSYAEARKFRMWVDEMKDPNKLSKLDELQQKFGKFDDYSDYNKERPIYSGEMPVYKYNADYFMGEGKTKIVYDVVEKPKYISPEEGEFFYYDEFILEEADKGYKREKAEEEKNKLQNKV